MHYAFVFFLKIAKNTITKNGVLMDIKWICKISINHENILYSSQVGWANDRAVCPPYKVYTKKPRLQKQPRLPISKQRR